MVGRMDRIVITMVMRRRGWYRRRHSKVRWVWKSLCFASDMRTVEAWTVFGIGMSGRWWMIGLELWSGMVWHL